ncbi:MAG: hypothetical protein ACKPGI_10285, partial [Verrucomicrobiota bacterium]
MSRCDQRRTTRALQARRAVARSSTLDLLNDCTRLCTGARLYHAENLLAYLDFLPAAFREYGLPLELYVDCHSLLLPQIPDSLTQLGSALHYYGISLRYAHTPRPRAKSSDSAFTSNAASTSFSLPNRSSPR